jgi:hypothetical protein
LQCFRWGERESRERGFGVLIGEVLKTIYSRNEEGSDLRRGLPKQGVREELAEGRRWL